MRPIAESNIIHRDSKGVIRKWIDIETGDVMERHNFASRWRALMGWMGGPHAP
jgi:hypothetical protein